MEIIKHIKVEIRIQGPLTSLLPNFNSYQLKANLISSIPSPVPLPLYFEVNLQYIISFIYKYFSVINF